MCIYIYCFSPVVLYLSTTKNNRSGQNFWPKIKILNSLWELIIRKKSFLGVAVNSSRYDPSISSDEGNQLRSASDRRICICIYCFYRLVLYFSTSENNRSGQNFWPKIKILNSLRALITKKKSFLMIFDQIPTWHTLRLAIGSKLASA